MRTLLSKQEAVFRSGLGGDFPQCDLSDIFNTEEWEFRNCLGLELLEKMFAAEIDYCNVKAWTNQAYQIGDLVKNGGWYWISKRGGTSTEPLIANEYWTEAPKFNANADCGCDPNSEVKCGQLYNEIWCRYLARYLSLKVAKLSVPGVAIKMNGNGLSRSTGNGSIPADEREIKYRVQGFETQAIQTFENMMAWIKAKDREDCFGAFDALCKPIVKCADKPIAGCEASKPYTVGISVY